MKGVRDAIRELAKSGQMQVEIAKVISVHESERTIVAEIEEGLEVDNVRLTAIIDESDSFFVNYPKVDSDVLMAEFDEGNWVVLVISEIQKTHFKGEDFELVIENGNVKMSAAEITINGGENKGMVKVEPLTKVLTEMTNWMRNIDFVIRTTQVNTGSVGSPDLLQLAFKAAVTASQVPKVQGLGLENSKIKH